jgi:chromosome segregation ATPase
MKKVVLKHMKKEIIKISHLIVIVILIGTGQFITAQNTNSCCESEEQTWRKAKEDRNNARVKLDEAETHLNEMKKKFDEISKEFESAKKAYETAQKKLLDLKNQLKDSQFEEIKANEAYELSENELEFWAIAVQKAGKVVDETKARLDKCLKKNPLKCMKEAIAVATAEAAMGAAITEMNFAEADRDKKSASWKIAQTNIKIININIQYAEKDLNKAQKDLTNIEIGFKIYKSALDIAQKDFDEAQRALDEAQKAVKIAEWNLEFCKSNPKPCDDGNPYTENDRCTPEGCIGDPVNCKTYPNFK